jgi:transcriptional regulator with XRE-family HTH domain
MDTTSERASSPWLALRLSTGLSQREIERRLGWKRGHLSLIERGFPPTPEQARTLRAFYLSGQPESAA